MSLLKCENLILGYEGKSVVENLTFSVEAGDYLCILGENGSGKSTLMKTILGLRNPMSGTILYGDGLKNNEIGYLPQQTIVQRDFPASVKEIVMSGFLNSTGFRPFFNSTEKKIAKENMQRLDIENLANRCYRELSGGQQQRVLLARALCATRKLLVLDEPVAGLDPKVTIEMYELIKSLNDEGVTIIMVSHDMQAAVNYATKILHVSDKPEFFSSVDKYLNSKTGKLFTEATGGNEND